MESDDPANSIAWAHKLAVTHLRPKDTPPTEIPSPLPAGALTTSWSLDPYSLGSYSYIPSHPDKADGLPCTPLDFAELAMPVWNGALGFAGEHTHQNRHATVHGAYETGLREGKRVGIELMMRKEREKMTGV